MQKVERQGSLNFSDSGSGHGQKGYSSSLVIIGGRRIVKDSMWLCIREEQNGNSTKGSETRPICADESHVKYGGTCTWTLKMIHT